MSSKSRIYWIPLLAAILTPMPALATEVKLEPPTELAPPAVTGRDLTLSELKTLFNVNSAGQSTFRAKLQGDTAFLSGSMFLDCYQKAKFSTATDPETGIGFRVTDEHGALECQQKHKEAKHVCTVHGQCVFFDASTPGSNIDLAALDLAKPVRIEVLRSDPNDPAEPMKGDRTELVYRSQRVIDAEEEAARAEEELEKIRHLNLVVENCHADLKELKIAQRALAELVEIGEVTDYKDKQATLDKAYLNVFKDRIKSASLDDLEKLQSELTSWNSRKRGAYASEVADLFTRMAKRFTERDEAKPKDFARATQIMKDSQELQGLSDDKAKELKKETRDVKAAHALALGASGNIRAANKLYGQLHEQAMKDQARACSGKDVGEECDMADKALSDIRSIPGAVNAALAEQDALRRSRMASTNNGYFNGGGYNGGAYNPGFNGGFAGGFNGGGNTFSNPNFNAPVSNGQPMPNYQAPTGLPPAPGPSSGLGAYGASVLR